MTDIPQPDSLVRRRLLRWAASGLIAGASSLLPRPGLAARQGAKDPVDPQHLSLLNVHTSEKLALDCSPDGKVSLESLGGIDRFLRDHRDGTQHAIDPRLLDLLSSIVRLVGGNGTIHITSAYRSPRTNSILRMLYEGVAPHSYHMSGKAIDFWLPGCPLQDLHQAAVSLKGGGVGFYPASNFIHVDVGPVRYWGTFGRPLDEARVLGNGGGAGGGHARLTRWQMRRLALHRRRLEFDRRLRRKGRS